MSRKTIEILESDIVKRLSEIAFHFEERDSLCESLSSFTQDDAIAHGPKKVEFDRVVQRINNEELDILLKLVHLKDTVVKYFNARGQNIIEINVVDQFRPFRIASNFINIAKHGLRGRNSKSALHDYSTLVFKQESGRPASDDHLLGYITVINYEGELFQTLDIIRDLVRIWELFLRNHTDVDTDDFISRIAKVHSKLNGKSTYSMPIPEGMFRDAIRLSEKRKALDIK